MNFLTSNISYFRTYSGLILKREPIKSVIKGKGSVHKRPDMTYEDDDHFVWLLMCHLLQMTCDLTWIWPDLHATLDWVNIALTHVTTCHSLTLHFNLSIDINLSITNVYHVIYLNPIQIVIDTSLFVQSLYLYSTQIDVLTFQSIILSHYSFSVLFLIHPYNYNQNSYWRFMENRTLSFVD